MNKELQKYYEDRFSMMATSGWKALMEDVAEMIKSTDTLGGVIDERSLYFKRGELSIMRWLESLHSVSEKTYEEWQSANT